VIDRNWAARSIPTISEATTVPGNEGLARETAEARRRQIFDPYHQRISEVIGQRSREDGRPCWCRGLMNFGIEIRRDLIGDHSGQQQWADRLARILGAIEATLRAETMI
jgi:predicted N-formylglutamate amidohydrolase